MSSSPTNIIAAIKQGGPLADLFRKAATDARSVLADVLRQPWVEGIAGAVSEQAHAQLQSGVDASPLVVLRQCGAGCSACCHTVAADVTPLEAIVVAEYLLANLDPARLTVIRARLRENAARRTAMTAEQRSSIRLRCGLLGDNGLCQAYEARPLVCAGVFSLSRAACENAATSSALPTQNVPLDRPAKAWTMGVSGGLQRAIVEAGLDGNLYELNSIVLCALETPEAAARWLQGEDVFAHCICTDAHSPPRAVPPEIRTDAGHPTVPPPAMLRHAKRKAAGGLPRRR